MVEDSVEEYYQNIKKIYCRIDKALKKQKGVRLSWEDLLYLKMSYSDPIFRDEDVYGEMEE